MNPVAQAMQAPMASPTQPAAPMPRPMVPPPAQGQQASPMAIPNYQPAQAPVPTSQVSPVQAYQPPHQFFTGPMSTNFQPMGPPQSFGGPQVNPAQGQQGQQGFQTPQQYQPQQGFQPQSYPQAPQQGWQARAYQAPQYNQAPPQNPALQVRPPPSMSPVQPTMMPQMATPYAQQQQAQIQARPQTLQGPSMAMGNPVAHAMGGGTMQGAPPVTSLGAARPMQGNAQQGTDNSGIGAAMAGAAMSDATAKVIDQRTMADDFLDHMSPYSYHYKDPADEPRVVPTGGKYLGVMAQNLEQIPELGTQLVINTPRGKMVDQKTALSATMAGVGRLHERVRALEADAIKGGK